MFKITKFVIAAALTAIIAAPGMAQVVCPCWDANDLDDLGTYGPDQICKVNGKYPAQIAGEDSAGNTQNAQVTQDFGLLEISSCYYGPNEIHPLDNDTTISDDNVDQWCIQLISNECEGRKAIQIDTSGAKKDKSGGTKPYYDTSD